MEAADQHSPGSPPPVDRNPGGALAEPHRWQIPPLGRGNSRLGGVAVSMAEELGVAPMAVRYGFVLLALQGGWGVLLYALAWIGMAFSSGSTANLYQPQPKARSVRFRYVALAMIVTGLMLVGDLIGFTASNPYLVPIALLAFGVMVAWSQRSGDSGVWSTLRIAAAVAFIGAGLAAALYRISDNPWVAVIGLVLAVVPVSVVALPSLTRIGRDLDEERSERVRADERARVAAHLHDSVLQTLTLIQKSGDDADRMALLARQQERELRAWLYGTSRPDATATRMEPALMAVAAAVEERHKLKVNVVVVGDEQDLDPTMLTELMSAVQEAVTNAAKHAEVDSVDVYAEVGQARVDVFVRDDGKGFDPTSVPSDRQGVAQSMIGRLERLGGTVTVDSAPGEGTEVEFGVPLEAPEGRAGNEVG